MDIEKRMKQLIESYKQIKPKINPNNFIIRIADGTNFWKSDRYSIFGVSDIGAKTIINSCEKGDFLWFCTRNSNGQLVAVATFDKIIPRFKGVNKYDKITDEEFGWTGEGWNCNYLIKYTNRYNLELENVYSGIKGQTQVRCIDNKKNFCPTMINLDEIYKNIINI